MAKTATRSAYGKTLAKLVQERKDIVVLDADLTKSTKTQDAKQACPQQHFNMGIAEGNMMAVAAGLAASGKVVYASSFAMFAAGRAYEQIRNSIAYPNLNVKVCATHAGITVGEDGASHQAIEDLALMRVIPNMHVFSPCDARQTAAIIRQVADIEGPCYVRLGREDVEDIYHDDELPFTVGKGNVLQKGSRLALLATGRMVQEAKAATTMLADAGISITLVDMPSIKPLDETLVLTLAAEHEILVSCEEHSIIGGLGSAVAEVLSEAKTNCVLHRLGMQDCFGRSGTPAKLLAYYHLDAESIKKQLLAILER